ncbi:MAG: methanesulfonate monooxygenase [Alphaproteobacteria bacterium]|nr:methanesulfonate monooxygenase [Alphaproteobacteria bacterium]
MVGFEIRQAVEELVYRSCMMLDDKDWKGFLALCGEEFRYTIAAHSPEIRRDMVWLDHDRKGMDTLFANLPRHNSDHSPITRHATVYTVDADTAGREATAVSALQVFRTQLDGGASELFAVGRMTDTIRLDGAASRLLRRVVRLDTRLIGYGYHVPF